mgnify:CR=1 FL=1
MAAAAGTAGGAERAQLTVRIRGRPCGPRFPQPFQHSECVEALTLAEPVGLRRIFSDSFTYDMALRLSQARGGLTDLRDRDFVE